MDKGDKIKLLENKKQSLSLLVNVNLGVILSFLAVATPIAASTIIAFNQNIVTYFMLGVYLLAAIITLKKPFVQLFNSSNLIGKIDSQVYNLVKGKDTLEDFIERLYAN